MTSRLPVLLCASLFCVSVFTTEAQGRKPAKKAAAAGFLAARSIFKAGTTVVVRNNVDAGDAVERFAVLTPGGPLVVEAAIMIDGNPFREARETLIDEMLDNADVNIDGKATWGEALRSARFTLGQIRIASTQQAYYIKRLDINRNRLVDRNEVRLYVAQFFQGPAFVLSADNDSRGGPADVETLLDADKDGMFSEKEIAAAAERLKSRDADNNDLLYPLELSGDPTTVDFTAGKPVAGRAAVWRRPQRRLAVLLGPTADARTLYKTIQDHYNNKAGHIVADNFYSFPALFQQLDKNANGKLERGETMALNSVKPQVVLTVEFGKGARGIALKHLSAELSKSAQAGQSISVSTRGVKLSLFADINNSNVFDFAMRANRYLDMFDADNNGYLESKEMPVRFARLFNGWDDNNDGKVYAKEIADSYTRKRSPKQSQVRANVTSSGHSLFEALDLSGDGRLSLREMRTAGRRIMSFDKNNDKQVSKKEIPLSVSVTFRLGNDTDVFPRPELGVFPKEELPIAKSDTPEWFTRMDRNGDGDVSLNEFLGDKETFKKLDTNNDGFIEPKEAQAAEKLK